MMSNSSSSSSILQFQMPSTKTIISTAASAAATAMVIRSVLREHVPKEIQHYLYQKLRGIFGSFSNQFTIVIEDLDGGGSLVPNQLFEAAEIYLQPTAAPDTRRFRVTLPKKETKISFVMDRNSELVDSFNGANLKWRLITKRIKPMYINGSDSYNPTYVSEIRRHELSFHKKHREMVLTMYLPHVLETSREMKQEKKALKLFTLRTDGRRSSRQGGTPWQSVTLDHPATFDTVAMDLGAKEVIIEDLERFLKRKGMYRRVGKAWKRGYLLYGPPGTGKSSLVAAMANYLNFDIYDLELGDVRNNSDLRKLLISTANRSILVVEDIDCSATVLDRNPRRTKYIDRNGMVVEDKKVTLSGLLNFVDGLWSSCGDERIIVFTTNHKDKLDPALLRPGRMDVHIHMSYCTSAGFDVLASNYLGTTRHPLFPTVKDLIGLSRVSPAEVGEQLMKHEDLELAVRGLIEFLEEKKNKATEEAEEAKNVFLQIEEGNSVSSNFLT